MEKTSTRRHWNKYWDQPDHQPVVRHDELLSNLVTVTNVRGKKILEVGAGMGGDSIFLAKKGAVVTALDFTQKALAEIDKNAKKEGVDISTVVADAQAMPFADETFDIVFHQGFLEHFPSPLELVLEQKRVLKTGGFLLVDVPQRFTTYTIKKHMLMVQGKWFAGWEREFSILELERLIEKAGLTLTRTYGWGYYGKLHTIRNLRLGEWYTSLWERIEQSRLKLYLCWCIGIIARK